jgi:hypothetical protein
MSGKFNLMSLENLLAFRPFTVVSTARDGERQATLTRVVILEVAQKKIGEPRNRPVKSPRLEWCIKCNDSLLAERIELTARKVRQPKRLLQLFFSCSFRNLRISCQKFGYFIGPPYFGER